METRHLAILGAGNMGRALIGGLLRKGMPPGRISIGETVPGAREALAREFGLQATADNAAAVEPAGIVVLAIKPQDVSAALQSLQPILQRNRPIVLSVAAGVRVAALQASCGPGVPIVRAMPNRPALVGAGVTGLYADGQVSQAQRTSAQDVMSAVGDVVWVQEEDALDIVTALSGSGPAYYFLLAELTMQAAVDLGLDEAAARRLAVGTLHGAGVLAHASDGDLARLRQEVTSKGGTTEAALQVLQAADLRGIVARAIEAAVNRSRELADLTGSPR